MHRFFAPGLDAGDEIVTLPRDEAEHLRRVLRLGVGDPVAVFDGRGHEFLARVASVVRRDVRLQIQSRVEPPPEPTVALTLAQAVLKGDKMDDVVRDGVMLGVAAIQPIVTKRTETTVAARLYRDGASGLAKSGPPIERWRGIEVVNRSEPEPGKVVYRLRFLAEKEGTESPERDFVFLRGDDGSWAVDSGDL